MTLQERLKRYLGQVPQIDPSAYVAPGATILGDVTIGPQSSIWPGAVLRGDINSIKIGEASNVQDGTIIHLADNYPTIIGDYVTIGHAAVVHACTLEDEVLVGMHATILDGAVVGKGSIIGAHTLVKSGMIVPPGSLVLGVPGKIVRNLTPEEQASNRALAEKYIQVSRAHNNNFG
jgi:carbonic anhydrase/acetyltransferase-like protein (isoleucine patch superfamily)